MLILTGALRMMIDNACPLLISHPACRTTRINLRGEERIRTDQPEYQAALTAYFGGSDVAVFIASRMHLGLTDTTRAAIRERLPSSIGRTRILLPPGN